MAPENSSRRTRREKKTLEAMLRLYCGESHGAEEALCGVCQELVEYAFERIENCPWGEEKPTCARCAIHCYRDHEREAVRERMRYAGPRMLTRHPVLAIQHLLDKRRASDKGSLVACRQRRRLEGGAS